MDKNKILIVDDEPHVLGLEEKLLTREGYCVIRSENGKEAIEKAAREHPDLIVTDIVLPDMNGAEIIHYLHKEMGLPIPVIFLTGMINKTEEVVNQLEIKVGQKSYPALAKPFEDKEFLTLVQKALKNLS